MFQAKSEEEIATERAWLDAEKLWLVHRGGFSGCRRSASHFGNGNTNENGSSGETNGKISIRLDDSGEVLHVDEDDIEKVKDRKKIYP